MKNNEFDEATLEIIDHIDYLLRDIMFHVSRVKEYIYETSDISDEVAEGVRLANAVINSYLFGFYTDWHMKKPDNGMEGTKSVSDKFRAWVKANYGELPKNYDFEEDNK